MPLLTVSAANMFAEQEGLSCWAEGQFLPPLKQGVSLATNKRGFFYEARGGRCAAARADLTPPFGHPSPRQMRAERGLRACEESRFRHRQQASES